MKKKLFVLILSIAMLLTFMPLQVFADTMPAVPDVSGFSAYAVSRFEVQVDWNKVDDSRIEYWVYRGTKPTGDWGSPVAKKAYNENGFTDKNVSVGNTYYYLMRQVLKEDGNTYFGNYSQMDYGRPTVAKIQGFSSKALDCTNALVSWSKTDDPDAEYWIYRGTKTSGDWGAPIAKCENDKTSFQDTKVKPTSRYYYLIRGVVKTSSGYIFGNYSPMDYAAPKAPPVEGFKAWAPNAKEAYVSWIPSSNHDIDYWLSRTEDPDQEDPDWGYPDLNPVAMLSYDMTPRLDLNITAGHKYYYKIQTFQVVDGEFYWGPYSRVDYAYPR